MPQCHKLDLRNAYHLLCIPEGEEWKAACNTPLGHFEHLVMPFDLTNTLAVFQALVNDVLLSVLKHIVCVAGRRTHLFPLSL